jgi:hypothetical protein
MRHVLGLQAHFPPPSFVITKDHTDEHLQHGGSSSSDAHSSLLVAGGERGGGGGGSGGRGSGSELTGQCWAFDGTSGKLTVALARAVVVTHVTLEQRPESETSASEASAAPQEVKVWALSSPTDQAPRLLGHLSYDQRRGQAKQTFKLETPTNTTTTTAGAAQASFITLDVRSNHGNPE